MKNLKKWGFALLVSALLIAGCKQENAVNKPPVNKTPSATEAHAHGIGPNGGIVFELGKYHAEFTVNHEKKECKVVVLSADEKNPQPVKVAAKELMLTTRETKTKDGKVVPRLTIKLLPKADSAGSVFVGSDASLAHVVNFAGMVIGEIDGKPSQGEFKEELEGHGHPGAMESAKTSGQPTDREVGLFLTPGGIYTQADIEKNGRVVPSVKFQGMSWPHDDDLKKGDKVCPVTDNKSDPNCSWYVNGKKYEFCCPPCLEKFVGWAKNQPAKIKEPEAYVK